MPAVATAAGRAPFKEIWRPGRDRSFVRTDLSNEARYSGPTSLVTYLPANTEEAAINSACLIIWKSRDIYLGASEALRCQMGPTFKARKGVVHAECVKKNVLLFPTTQVRIIIRALPEGGRS